MLPYIEIPLTQDAKGRNGWFKARRCFLWSMTGTRLLSLEIHSRRTKGIPAISLGLTPEEAIRLGTRLVRAGRDMKDATVPPPDFPAHGPEVFVTDPQEVPA